MMGKHASLATKMHSGRRFNSEGAVSGTAHPNQNHSKLVVSEQKSGIHGEQVWRRPSVNSFKNC